MDEWPKRTKLSEAVAAQWLLSHNWEWMRSEMTASTGHSAQVCEEVVKTPRDSPGLWAYVVSPGNVLAEQF
jgi:hypothetical protein